jgi:glycerol-3-phosphate acyltransferase PlsY
MFSPWIGFKGGKGVATGLGALLGVYPILTIPGVGAFVVFLATLGIWRYVGLSSVLAAGSLPLWTWYLFQILAKGVPPDSPKQPPDAWPYLAVTIALAALVIIKHRGNLARIGAGTEPKVGTPPESRRPPPTPTPSENTPSESTTDATVDN